MDSIRQQAIERARASMPHGVFDTLPSVAQDSIVASQLTIIEAEHREQQLILREQQMAIEKEQVCIREQQIAIDKQYAEQQLQQVTTNLENLQHLAENLYTIDEYTPSVNDLKDATRSKAMLATTREYKQVAAEALQLLQDNVITADEGKQRTDDIMKTLMRTMDARRQRERYNSGKIIKKVVDQDMLHVRKYASHQSSFAIEECVDTTLIEYDTLALVVPSKEELSKRINEQRILCINSSKDKDDLIHSNSLTMFIRGNKYFHSYTKNICTVDEYGNMRDNWYDEFRNNIVDKFKNIINSDNYELEPLELSAVKVHLYYHLHKIECVDKWFPNGATPKYVKYKDFTLYTANDMDVPCLQQIVEYFDEVYDETMSIQDMLAPRMVIYGHPARGNITQLTKYDDLVWDYHEDIATNDCINVARIVKYNGHVGVVTSIDVGKNYNSRYTKKTMIDVNSVNDAVDVFVDIEAFASSTPGKYLISTPYLVCWTYGDSVVNVTGPTCVEQFVTMLLEQYEGSEICLYAWYGSGYDYQHIYKYLKKRCVDDNTFIKNNSIIYSRMRFDKNTVVHLKDPFLFILCSLDKAAKAFDVLNKGSFPHSIISTWSDLDKIIEDWYVVRSEPVETYDVDNKRMLITTRCYNDIVERANLKTIMDKAIEYCTVDVLAMQAIWSKFTTLVHDELGITIAPNIFTLSQMSMKLMMSMMPHNIRLSIPDVDEYEFIKGGMYGGRVQAINGVYEEDIYYADVVSLYPSAMKLLKHPIGEPHKVNDIDWSKLGIYEVILTSTHRPEKYNDFLPFRDEDGKLSYHWRSHWKGTYHTYDLMIAEELGYEIECIRGCEWVGDYVFDNFINKLFKLKQDNDGPVRQIAKIALNGGGYGKFVQKPINSNVHIVKKCIVHAHFDRLKGNHDGMVVKGGMLIEKPSFYELDDEWDKMVIDDPHATPRYATQVGVSILSASRYRLFKLLQQFDGIDVIYSDTDSIFVKASSVDRDVWISKMGKDIGMLDDTLNGVKHGIINRMYIAGPKMYAYEYHDDVGMPQYVCKMKGVRNDSLRITHFKHLMGDVDNKLTYNIMVMNKNVVGVKMLHTVKNITQT